MAIYALHQQLNRQINVQFAVMLDHWRAPLRLIFLIQHFEHLVYLNYLNLNIAQVSINISKLKKYKAI